MNIKNRIMIAFGCFLFIGLSTLSYPFTKKAFGLVCHGLSDRCFWLFDTPMLLCARCTSIYFFIGLTFLVRPFSFGKQKKILITSLILLALDVTLEHFDIYSNIFFIRILVGSFMGFAVANLLLPERISS